MIKKTDSENKIEKSNSLNAEARIKKIVKLIVNRKVTTFSTLRREDKITIIAGCGIEFGHIDIPEDVDSIDDIKNFVENYYL